MENLLSKPASEHGPSALAACIEEVLYADCSRVTPEEVRREEGILPETFTSSGKDPPFPLKLYRFLSDPELRSAIAWLPHGRAWRIVDTKELERKILPRHFKHSQIKSFMRQVTGWGFRRVTDGKDEGAYYHKFFLRGLPHVCLKMRRVTGKRSKLKSKVMAGTPDFYDLTKNHPLPDVDGNWPDGAESTDQVSTSNFAHYGLETQPHQGKSNLGAVVGGNISLPQHLLGIAQPPIATPMGWLPNNPLAQSSPIVSLELSSLMHRLNSIQGLQSTRTLNDILSSSMHDQAEFGLPQQQLLQHLLQQPSNAGIFQSLQNLFQQPVSVQSILTVQSMATHSSSTLQTPQGQLPQMQSMDLPSAASPAATAASNKSSETTSESVGNAAKERIRESKKSAQPSQKRVESPEESKKSSASGEEEQRADTSSVSRPFLSVPNSGESVSQSSSSSGLQESGSESSTSAGNSEEQCAHDNSLTSRQCKQRQEAGSALFSLSRCAGSSKGSESIQSSSSVSMSETGSDSGPQPSESSGWESGTSRQGQGDAPHDKRLHSHRSKNLHTLEFTRQTTSLSELGSDGGEKLPVPSTETRKSPPSKELSVNQASDQSSDSADGSDASSESLRQLWDLISSADESNSNSASSLVKASRGLVGDLLGSDHRNNPLSDRSTESDVTFAPSSTKNAKRRSGSVEAKTQSNVTTTAPSSLDVAAKAMTLGILWGMKRCGNAPEVTTTTSNSSSTSRAGELGSSSNFDEVEKDVKAFLTNPSLRLSSAPTLNRPEMQVQGPSSDDTGSDELRPSSVSGSSDDEDAKKRQSKKHHEDAGGTAKLGKSMEQQKRSTSAFEPPTEVAWGHKRKAFHSGPVPSAKRKSLSHCSLASGAATFTGEAEVRAATSGREKVGVTRSESNLTTTLSDCSSISTSNLKKLDKQNGLGGGAENGSNSIISSQASDVSGEDFETVSSNFGSASSNNDFPTTNTSGVTSGSTSNPAGSSTDSSGSTAGDSAAACPVPDCGNKVLMATDFEKKKKAAGSLESAGPAKKRTRFAST